MPSLPVGTLDFINGTCRCFCVNLQRTYRTVFFFSSICLCSFVGNKATCSSFLTNYKNFVTSSASVVNV